MFYLEYLYFIYLGYSRVALVSEPHGMDLVIYIYPILWYRLNNTVTEITETSCDIILDYFLFGG